MVPSRRKDAVCKKMAGIWYELKHGSRKMLKGEWEDEQDERKTNEYLDELEFLAETAGAEVVKRFTQKLDQANSVTYVGKG